MNYEEMDYYELNMAFFHFKLMRYANIIQLMGVDCFIPLNCAMTIYKLFIDLSFFNIIFFFKITTELRFYINCCYFDIQEGIAHHAHIHGKT